MNTSFAKKRENRKADELSHYADCRTDFLFYRLNHWEMSIRKHLVFRQPLIKSKIIMFDKVKNGLIKKNKT